MTTPGNGDNFTTRTSDPRRLAGLVSITDNAADAWTPQDLAAIWKHQLNSPLTFDLSTVSPTVGETITTFTRADPAPLATFADLLKHPHPPIELLQWLKDFAKAQSNDGALPAEIAATLYYASIVLARLLCQRRISELDEKSLKTGIERVIDKPWLDAQTRQLLQAGLSDLVR